MQAEHLMRRRLATRLLGWCALGALALCAGARAQPPASAPTAPPAAELRFGMSADFTGQLASISLAMRRGIEAAFKEFNDAGGLNGSTLRLYALDDAFEPARAARNSHELIDRHNILGFIGNVGTATSIIVAPIASSRGVPFIAPLTGADPLRATPPDPFIFNFRASYAQETAAMVEALVTHARLAPEDIAFVTQRNSFGDSAYRGGLQALKTACRCSRLRTVHARLERDAADVDSAVAEFLLAPHPPKAVILALPSDSAAAIIRRARELDIDACFLTTSFADPVRLTAALGSNAECLIFTQVVPPPSDDSPAYRRFVAALAALDPAAAPSAFSFEGYLAARTLILALQRLDTTPTRANIAAALDSLGDFDLGLGTPLRFGPGRHQASDAVWPAYIRDGKLTRFSWNQAAPLSRTPTQPKKVGP